MPFQMKNILIIGDSEASVFRRAAAELEQRFQIAIQVDSCPGRSILQSGEALKAAFSAKIDVVLLMGITSMAWRKVPLEGAPGVSLITWNPDANWNGIPEFMKDVLDHCTLRNRHVVVHLVLPSVKNIYQYNVYILAKNNNKQYITLMEKDHRFQRDILFKRAKDIYSKSLSLKNDAYSWYPKNILMMNHAFNHYVDTVWCLPTCAGPHARFLRGVRPEFQFVEMLHDGLHYTPLCVYHFFDSLRGLERWLVLRRKNGSSPAAPVAASVPSSAVDPSHTSPSTSGGAQVTNSPTVMVVETLVAVSPSVSPGGASVDLLLDQDAVEPQEDVLQTANLFAERHILDISSDLVDTPPMAVQSMLPLVKSPVLQTPTRGNMRGREPIASRVLQLQDLVEFQPPTAGVFSCVQETTEIPSHWGETLEGLETPSPLESSRAAPNLISTPLVLLHPLPEAKERQLWFYLQGLERCLVPEEASAALRWDILTRAQQMLEWMKEGKTDPPGS